ncbi:MAG: hypothetical protein AW09_003957 [Candidatus Accumulibacter phosphatis]|uniref:Uncharacterized protein n=1 Tax=Candidatus Accumulibacter phosphatis TaxID=327160 RepID=A0A080LRP8_9PROT|nr:MAG: hypothetical protein AW09_003957 [Candidatus Accumulibacter phosphatis]
MAKPPISAAGLSGMRWMKNTWNRTTTIKVGARSRAASCRSSRMTRNSEPSPILARITRRGAASLWRGL